MGWFLYISCMFIQQSEVEKFRESRAQEEERLRSRFKNKTIYVRSVLARECSNISLDSRPDRTSLYNKLYNNQKECLFSITFTSAEKSEMAPVPLFLDGQYQ
jgi:hypothetical protein